MILNPPPPPPIYRRKKPSGVLSFSQESLWFLQQLDPENNAYNLTYLYQFTGGVDRYALEQALNEVMRRHEPLRTCYPNQGGRPVQIIQPFKPFSLPYVDFTGLTDGDRRQAVREYAVENGRRPYDLQRGPLARFALLHSSSDEDALFIGTHHIGSDGWSQNVIFSELARFYNAFHAGVEPDVPELPIQYSDYAAWQREWLSGKTLAEYINHWKTILSGELPILDLPTDRSRPSVQTYRGARIYFHLQPGMAAKIREYCRKERLTAFHFFLGAFGILMMRYTGQEDIILGSPFANRPRSELDTLVGEFINTLPLRLSLNGNPSVRSLLTEVRNVMMDALIWQAIPFEALVSQLHLDRDLSRTPVFQVLINMRNVPKRSAPMEGIQIEDILVENTTAAFDISLELDDEGKQFGTAVRFNVDLFDRTTIQNMISHFQNIIDAMLKDPECPIQLLDMLTPLERQCLLVDWNDTAKEYTQQCIHDVITRQAAKHPDALAVLCNGRQMTYSTLEKRSNQLACRLLADGVQPGALVGIFLPRSENMVVAQLAILKMGGAYVPFDLTYPFERMLYILEETRPSCMVSLSSLESQIPGKVRKIHLDQDAVELEACPDRVAFPGTGPDSLVNVIYTSGSTGRPKGVMNAQRGMMNYMNYLVETFRLRMGERVVQFTPLSFDPSIRDTLGVLTFGGTIVLMDDEQMRNPDFICQTIVKQQVSCILSIVPTMLRELAGVFKERKAAQNPLRLVMPSGEALQLSDITLVRDTFGQAVQIVNQYGPTECSMISTMYPVPAEIPPAAQTVPIGKPVSNTHAYVLDHFHNPVPVGVKGVLYIGGIGVSRGYWNQPELTAKQFFPNPFKEGDRMYRTGDIVRQLSDGTICYLGRSDDQIKIRGYRVELHEIETVIGEFSNIKAAAVVLRKGSGSDSEALAAYITLSTKKQAFFMEDLRRYLQDRLPFYMLPSTITILEDMPLTPNQKIDRRALPNPEDGKREDQYLAPRNDVEERLVSIWMDLLQVKQVGVKDNFFALGGHSLLAVRLMARIQEEFGWVLPLVLLFKESTVEALAVALTDYNEARQDDDHPLSARLEDGPGDPLTTGLPGLANSDDPSDLVSRKKLNKGTQP